MSEEERKELMLWPLVAAALDEIERLEARCAAMREALEAVKAEFLNGPYLMGNIKPGCIAKVERALLEVKD